MSVLSIPRIFFKGYAQWDPCTTNNNDQWPTYAFARAELNWDFLAQQVPPITRQNFQTTFPTWAQTLQLYTQPGTPPTQWYQPPAEWNYYGGNDFSLQGNNNQQTLVTGGQTAYGSQPVTSDSLVNSAVSILGDPYPWSPSNPSSARLVDINPAAFWSTDFYLRYFQMGNNTGPYVYGEIAPDTRMCSRWMNVQRNLGSMEIAGVAGVVAQTCLPTSTLTITPGGSNLLTQLQQGLQQSGVQGVMVRFVIYMTQYFTGDEFASCTGLSGSDLLTCQYTTLTKLWAEALQNGNTPMQNPAVANVLGSVGLWMDNELVSMPGGRYLVPSALVQPNNIPTTPGQSPVTTGLGPAVAELHSDGNQEYLSLDLSSTIPEIDMSGTKANIGPLMVTLQPASGQSVTIGTIDYSGSGPSYDQAAYEATSGIIDLLLPDNVTAKQVQEGTLSIQLVTPGIPVAALSETALSPDAITVQTDQRGIRIDESDTGSLTIQINQRGAAPTQTVNVLMAQYGPDPPPPQANAGAWTLLDADTALIKFQNVTDNTIVVPASAGGVAEITFTPIRPGFPMIVFFPFLDGDTKPVPPPAIIPVFQPGGALTIASAFFSCVRTMPFDNNLPQEFADLWNQTHSMDDAWNYVYNNVLYVYDMLYPVMKYYAGIDLGTQSSVDQSISSILLLTSATMLDKTVYMPVTREMSYGKRTVLEMYGYLVEKNGSVQTLEPPQGSYK